MTAPTPYIHFPGTTRAALTFYGDVFGCDVQVHPLEEFGRTDGPADAVAHGYLRSGPVELFAADVTGDAYDGQVVDRDGLHWLLGFEGEG